MEGWMSPEELNWELKFDILVTEDTSSKVQLLGSAKKLDVGTREPQLAKVCHPVLKVYNTYSCQLEAQPSIHSVTVYNY